MDVGLSALLWSFHSSCRRLRQLECDSTTTKQTPINTHVEASIELSHNLYTLFQNIMLSFFCSLLAHSRKLRNSAL